MPSALDGITVLDMTQGHAGALAAMFLCDNGARVVRIELPGGEALRQWPGYVMWDRGKESIALDIARRTPEFHELVRSSDVLIESFAPSSEHQAIVGYDKLSAINPRLVHCSITAYGREGPLKNEPPIDELVMARVGILASQPGFRPGPVHVVHPCPSTGAALLAAQGIVASLYAREKTGLGRKVETSLMAGALVYSPKVWGENLKPRPFQPSPFGGGPFYSVFECADGRWIQIACIHGGFVDIAAAVLGIADVMADPRYGDGRMPRDEAARKELFDIVAGVVKTKRYAEWAELFEAADVPYARAGTTDEAFDDPQVRHNGLVMELHDPIVGRTLQLGLPIKLSVTPGKVKGPRPAFGQHTGAVLKELAVCPPAEAAPGGEGLRGELGPPLRGVRVLEMTNVIAGPTAGKMLAELGADVIKLESLDGDISRPGGYNYFVYLNSGKRSVSVNTRTAEGREVARRLAERADVMLANLRPGATDRMGLDSDTLAKLNPGIIQAHVTAFGWDGPYAHRPGLDPLAQAIMGLQRAQGGQDNPPVFLSALAPSDYTAGCMASLGVLLALYVRERTGAAQRIDANLLAGAAVMCGDGFVKYEGRPPRRLADKNQYGLSALHRLYETGEGWIYIAAEAERHRRALCRAIGRDDLAHKGREADDAALAAGLAQVFRQQPAYEWVRRLKAEGVPCAPVVEYRDGGFFSDAEVATPDMVHSTEHPILGKMRYSAVGLRFGGVRPMEFRRTPLLGEHTREALSDAGYTDSEIEALYSSGIVMTEGQPVG